MWTFLLSQFVISAIQSRQFKTPEVTEPGCQKTRWSTILATHRLQKLLTDTKKTQKQQWVSKDWSFCNGDWLMVSWRCLICLLVLLICQESQVRQSSARQRPDQWWLVAEEYLVFQSSDLWWRPAPQGREPNRPWYVRRCRDQLTMSSWPRQRQRDMSFRPRLS